MTTRSRRFSPRRSGRRTSRKVWVNRIIQGALTIDTIQLFDMLTSAVDFMKFDSTILRVLFPSLSVSFDATATLGNREFAFSVFTGPENLDSADVPDLFTSGIGQPHMSYAKNNFRLAATAQSVTTDLRPNGETLDIKAKRRFKENDTTLWLALQNNLITNDATIEINGLCRTLLLIP